MVNAIVGYTGFVGLHMLECFKFDNFYNSKNFKSAKGETFDLCVFCGAPAQKWKANKFPNEDNTIIQEIITILKTIQIRKFVLISTIDVYQNVNAEEDEDVVINCDQNHTYGKNRYILEQFIQSHFIDHHIIRLPALFGKGLKKNIIYDLLHKKEPIQKNTCFQWYCLDWLKEDIQIILKNNIKICNLFTEPIKTELILNYFENIFKRSVCVDLTMGKRYNNCTKWGILFNSKTSYVRNQHDVIQKLIQFFNFEKIDKSKLCVSNICVDTVSQIQLAGILKLYGIQNIQVAPTKLILWNEIDKINLDVYKSFGLNVYSFQSITYTLNHLNIFDKPTQGELLVHLKKVIDCAHNNNVNVLVFGCPKNRFILKQDFISNVNTFVDFFKKLGLYLIDKNVIICLENNSTEYGCNFMNTIEQCAKVVKQINHPNIKMMVDLGNAIMENDDDWNQLAKYNDIIYNVDISQPHMKDFSRINVNVHNEFQKQLQQMSYPNMINLEMIIKDKDEELNVLGKSLKTFIQVYGS